MDDLAVIASGAHKMAIPEVIVPKNAPTWVREMFPPLIRSIYVSCNNNIEGLVVDFNRSLELMSDFGPPKKDGEFLFFDFSDTNLVNPLKFSKLSPPKY